MFSIPEFSTFANLDFPHQKVIADILGRKGIHSSDFAFYNLMGWYVKHPPKISRVEEHLIVKLEGPEESCLFLPPLGKVPSAKPLHLLLDFLSAQECPLEIKYMSKSMLEELPNDLVPKRVEPQSGDFDYLYSRQELAELAGRKFHQKKNFVNRILEEESPEIEMIYEGNASDVLLYLDEWYKEFPMDDLSVHLEALAAHRMLPLIKKIGGLGIFVKIGGKPVGMSVASPINSRCWVVTLEKADKSKKGLYQFINWALVNRLPKEVDLINRETDLGLEGLRNAKLSYHPIAFEEKFHLIF